MDLEQIKRVCKKDASCWSKMLQGGVSELFDISPDRVDLTGKPAIGHKFVLFKSEGDVKKVERGERMKTLSLTDLLNDEDLTKEEKAEIQAAFDSADNFDKEGVEETTIEAAALVDEIRNLVMQMDNDILKGEILSLLESTYPVAMQKCVEDAITRRATWLADHSRHVDLEQAREIVRKSVANPTFETGLYKPHKLSGVDKGRIDSIKGLLGKLGEDSQFKIGPKIVTMLDNLMNYYDELIDRKLRGERMEQKLHDFASQFGVEPAEGKKLVFEKSAQDTAEIEVERLAAILQVEDPSLSNVAARARVWKANPDLMRSASA